MNNTNQFPFFPGIEGEQLNSPALSYLSLVHNSTTGPADYASDRDYPMHPLAYSPLTKNATGIADLFFTQACNYRN